MHDGPICILHFTSKLITAATNWLNATTSFAVQGDRSIALLLLIGWVLLQGCCPLPASVFV